MGSAEKCLCHGYTLDEIERRKKYHKCQIEKGCEWYYGYDGKRKHMKYHEKKCDTQSHEWIVKADSVDKKYYECEWCEAEMQEIKWQKIIQKY